MADLSITAANVAIGGEGVFVENAQAGVAVERGQTVYLDGADGKYRLAQADGSSAEAEVQGVVLTAAAADGYFLLCRSGPVVIGATLTKGATYNVSANAGGIAPASDYSDGDFISRVGYAISASVLVVDPQATGVQ